MPEQQRPHQQHVISGVNGVYVVIDESGNIRFVDPQTRTISKGGQLANQRPTPPLAIASSEPPYELCVAVNGTGRVWIGSVRGGEFEELKEG